MPSAGRRYLGISCEKERAAYVGETVSSESSSSLCIDPGIRGGQGGSSLFLIEINNENQSCYCHGDERSRGAAARRRGSAPRAQDDLEWAVDVDARWRVRRVARRQRLGQV